MFSFTEHLLFWTKQIKRLTVAFSLATNLKLCDISQKSRVPPFQVFAIVFLVC